MGKDLKIASISGGVTKIESQLPVLTGDDLIDSLVAQTMKLLDDDKKDADELYEYIRSLAEKKTDEAPFQKAAIDALRLRTINTDKAVKLVELISRVRLSKERRTPVKKDNNDEGDLIEIINKINKEDEDETK